MEFASSPCVCAAVWLPPTVQKTLTLGELETLHCPYVNGFFFAFVSMWLSDESEICPGCHLAFSL